MSVGRVVAPLHHKLCNYLHQGGYVLLGVCPVVCLFFCLLATSCKTTDRM